MQTSDDITALKAALRRDVLARREALPPHARQAAAATIAARDLPVAVTPGLVVSGYRFADAGAALALPAIARRGLPLIMRTWAFGDAMSSGQWGIREPAADAPEVFPDVVLAPLLAFDRRGQRLGYGAGYYDMTIARLRTMHPVTVIGIAFAVQEVPEVPTTAFDAPLDLVLTEHEVLDFRRTGD